MTTKLFRTASLIHFSMFDSSSIINESNSNLMRKVIMSSLVVCQKILSGFVAYKREYFHKLNFTVTSAGSFFF